MMLMLISFIFTSPCFTIPLSLPTDSQSHILSVLIFSTHGDDDEVRFLILEIHSWFLFCKHVSWQFSFLYNQTPETLPCYFPIFTFYFSHSEKELSLLIVLKGCFLRLIVRFINTSFHIRFPSFISWKQNITFINPTCCRWSTYLFDMNLVKEYKLGGCQWRKLVFVVTVWYMPYLQLTPSVISKQYGEGEMIWIIIFVSVYDFFAFLICTYSLSSGIQLIIINHFFVWLRLASFHLPSLLVPCWILCILVILGWSIKKDRSTVDLHTALKPLWWQWQLMIWVV